MESKVCTKCRTERPLNEFANFSRGANGRRAQCKHCDKAYAQKIGKRLSTESEDYAVNQSTMRNHMYLHFGFWEPARTAMERMQDRRDIKKYYRPEQNEKIERQ